MGPRPWSRCGIELLLFVSIFVTSPLFSSEPTPVHFDAQRTRVLPSGIEEVAGDVTVFVPGMIMKSDVALIDRKRNLVTAKQNVVLIDGQSVVLGDKVEFDLSTRLFRVDHGVIEGNVPQKVLERRRAILGYAGIVRTDRLQRHLDRIDSQKRKLEKRYRDHHRNNSIMSAITVNRIVDQYAVLLQSEYMMRNFDGDVYGNQLREPFAHRRQSVENLSRYPSLSLNLGGRWGYFRYSGEVIERVSPDEYRSKVGYFTACECQDDEIVPWLFRFSESAFVHHGYAELSDSVVEVAGVPVAYVPYMRFPIRNVRQTGLLWPDFSFSTDDGIQFSQPLFIASDDDHDSTVTFKYFQKRGTGVDFEYRHKFSQHSSFTVNVSGIRDSAWLQHHVNREALADFYHQGLTAAAASTEPGPMTGLDAVSTRQWWANDPRYSGCLEPGADPERCRALINESLLGPGNRFRGQLEWSGFTALSPRWSLVTSGNTLSDNRYTQDMSLGLGQVFFKSDEPDLYALSHLHVHGDGSDVYVGAGMAYANSLTQDSLYSDFSIPAYLQMQSRYVSLFPDSFPRFAYGSVRSSFQWLKVPGQELAPIAGGADITRELGEGWRQDGQIDVRIPIPNAGPLSLEVFGEGDFRLVSDSYLSSDQFDEDRPVSFIHSSRVGVGFGLPVNGKATFNRDGNGRVELEHVMMWNCVLSYRPYVRSYGDYGATDRILPSGDLSQGHGPLTYYGSDQRDRESPVSIERHHTLIPHKKLIFSTAHDWYYTILEALWAPGSDVGSRDFRSLAQAKLHESLSLYQEYHGKLSSSIPKFERSSRYQPLHFDALISYDLDDDGNERPWSDLGVKARVAYRGIGLDATGTFDVYDHLFKRMNFNLGLPTLWRNNFGLSLQIDQVLSDPKDPDSSLNRVITKQVTWQLFLSPITTGVSATWRTSENNGVVTSEPQPLLGAGIEYLSRTNCWGVRFMWEKDFGVLDWRDGRVYLGLIVNFFNQRNEYGNLLGDDENA